MYHAEKIWEQYIHPDDIETYKDAVDAVLCGNAQLKSTLKTGLDALKVLEEIKGKIK